MINNDHYITITVSPIVGTVVKTSNDEKIGEISGVVVDTKTGKAPFVVLALDTKPHLSSRKYIILSWKRFKRNTGHQHEYFLNIDKNRLNNLHGCYSDYTSGCPQYALEKSVNKRSEAPRILLAS